MVCIYHEGWIKDSKKEEVICTGEILVADIMSLRNENAISVDVPLKYTEAKQKTMTKSLNVNDPQPVHPKLEVRIKNLSSITSLFAPSCSTYVEGVRIADDTLSKQILKLALNRARRMAVYLGLRMVEIQGIFNFKYPFFSYICILVAN